jgi:hypothetical protein
MLGVSDSFRASANGLDVHSGGSNLQYDAALDALSCSLLVS